MVVDAAIADGGAEIRKVRVPRTRYGRQETLPRYAPPVAAATDTPTVTARPRFTLEMPRPALGDDGAPAGAWELLLWLVLLGAALLAARTADVVRREVMQPGLTSLVLGTTATGARLVGLGLAGLVLFRIAPHFAPVSPWLLAGLGVLLLLGVRGLVPDVIAYFVLRAERQVRAGRRVVTERVSGQVVQVGLRTTRIRDETGHEVAVPNHLFLEGPLRAEPRASALHEVQVHWPEGESASIRQRLEDAARASVWVPIGAEVAVRRDAGQPEIWHVRAEILDPRFAERFASELAELHGRADTSVAE